MISLVLAGLLAVMPEAASVVPSDVDLKTYETAKNQVNPSSQAQVELALWCETHGLQAERVKHLALAVLKDPTNVTARGLLGLVAFHGRWQTPGAIGERLKSDEALTAKLAEYNRRRGELLNSLEKKGTWSRSARQAGAKEHVKLGLWCETQGLDAEAKAHFTSATVLDPNQELTWKHLGYVKHGGRWMSRQQLEADRRESEAQAKAAKTWDPVLKTWRGWLADAEKREAAKGLLAEIRDPRAVPSIVRVFKGGNEADLTLAIQLLGQIDSPPSTKALSELAVLNPALTVRSAATKVLKSREPRDYAGQLVDMIQSPMRYKVQPVAGPGSPGAIEVETPRFKMLRMYDAPPAFQLSSQFFGYIGYDDNGLPVAARGVELRKMSKESPQMAAHDLEKIEARTGQLLFEANLKAVDSQARLSADVYAIELSNAQVAQINSRIVPVLTETLDAPAELKDSEDKWQTWWNDKLGYKYEPPPQSQVAVNASPQGASTPDL